MAKQLIFSGNWCRLIRFTRDGMPPAFITETPDGIDGLGQTRWGGVTRNVPECFAELGEEMYRLSVENNNLRDSIANTNAAAIRPKVDERKRK